jgi:hypothetical protein
MDDMPKIKHRQTYLTDKETVTVSLWILLLLMTSWGYSSYSSNSHLNIELRPLGAIAAPAVCVLITVKIWQDIRKLLAEGQQIPPTYRLMGSAKNMLLLLPLCLGFTFYDDQATFQLGGGTSLITGLFGGFAILLYETLKSIGCYSTQTECFQNSK